MYQTLHTLNEQHIELLSEIHSQAFHKGPMFKALFDSKVEDVKWVAKLRFKLMQERYLTLLSQDPLAFSSWLKPGETDTHSVWKQIRVGYWKSPFKFGIQTFKHMLKFGNHEQDLMNKFSSRNAYILDIIAVHPNHQGRGIGGELLKPVLKKAKEEKNDVLVFTQDPRNRAFYEKYGFKLIEEHPVYLGVNAYVFEIRNS